MDDPRLEAGWWGVEQDRGAVWRWTDGAAVLPGIRGPAVLEVVVGRSRGYPAKDARD